MSWQCVDAVLRSQMPAPQKFTLVALAERATADGSEMWASISDLAMRTSKSRRIVTRHLAWCEEQGLITELSGRRIHGASRAAVGGRNRCPRYRLNREPLAAYRPASKPCHPDHGFECKPCRPDHGFEPIPCLPDQGFEAKPCPPDQGLDIATSAETMIPRTETVIPMTETLIQGSPDPKVPKEPGSTAASPPLSPKTRNGSTRVRHRLLARIPAADGNVGVIVKVVHTVFDEAGRSSPDDPDLMDLVKERCAQKHIAYGPPEVAVDVVARAMTLAHLQRTLGPRTS